MKKDIPTHKVTDIAVAITPKGNEEEFWDVFLLNLKQVEIKNVLITSRGYGQLDGAKVETTKLRYFYEVILPNMAVKVELIDPKLFGLANEYWISFQLDGFMYDKKYVFVNGSFNEENFTTIPIVETQGIMIK